MAGGRWGTPGAHAHSNKVNQSMEPMVFVDSTGSEGLDWTPYSVGYWHNRLADKMFARFSKALGTPAPAAAPSLNHRLGVWRAGSLARVAALHVH